MHKKASFGKPFGRERVEESQKLLKSAEKYFYPNFSSLWVKLKQKNLFSITDEILGLLDNMLTANYEYSCSNKENLPFQIKLSKKI